jgi:membrane protein implicated in regulation of membrane protease activity
MNLSPDIIWLLLGIILIFSEFFVPNLVISFFGGGALITALTTWSQITPNLPLQLLVFISSSLFLLLFLRKYLKRIFLGKLEDRDESQEFNVEIGKIVQVLEAVKPGETGGKVKYQGTPWQARSSQRIEVGENAVICGKDNITLIVEKVKSKKNK